MTLPYSIIRIYFYLNFYRYIFVSYRLSSRIVVRGLRCARSQQKVYTGKKILLMKTLYLSRVIVGMNDFFFFNICIFEPTSKFLTPHRPLFLSKPEHTLNAKRSVILRIYVTISLLCHYKGTVAATKPEIYPTNCPFSWYDTSIFINALFWGLTIILL